MFVCTIRISYIYENMHLIKICLSGILVLLSLLWITIQQLFLPAEYMNHLFVDTSKNAAVDFLQLKRDWCRIRGKSISWRDIIEPCQRNRISMANPRFATNPYLSHVAQIIRKPAGEHTRIRIDTYNSQGALKTFGGDSIRVYLHGVENIAAAVFDLKNGSYEALVMVMTPDEYKLKVILDYSQCNGFKDPPTQWYFKAHCPDKTIERRIPNDVLSQLTDYINVEISPGISINIQPPRYDLRDLNVLMKNSDCGYSCKKIWDGHGVWTSREEWKPYVSQSIIGKQGQTEENKHLNHSTLWVYGDSISYYLHQRLERTNVCKNIFKQCKNTYNWIYPKTLYELNHFCSDVDINITKLRDYFRAVLLEKEMDANSVLLFNLGAHFIKNTSFRKYRDIIDAFIEELKIYNGEVIWKSTTAIHEQNVEIMGSFRRFMTSQRALLYNAYANAAICNAGIKLLDIYPITASYPLGTKDGVHYHRNASIPIDNLINRYFLP